MSTEAAFAAVQQQFVTLGETVDQLRREVQVVARGHSDAHTQQEASSATISRLSARLDEWVPKLDDLYSQVRTLQQRPSGSGGAGTSKLDRLFDPKVFAPECYTLVIILKYSQICSGCYFECNYLYLVE